MRMTRKALQKGVGTGAARGFLDGQMLIATPGMQDERFSRSLIYMCAHSSEGAMGIVVNQPAAHISFPDLLVKLDVIPKAEKIQLPPGAGADFFIENSTLPIDEGVCLTATLDILKAIARGAGPASAILALGYAGWSPGQLESELQHNGWLHCSADPELIFGTDVGAKYDRAMQKIGIRPGMLSSDVGHA